MSKIIDENILVSNDQSVKDTGKNKNISIDKNSLTKSIDEITDILISINKIKSPIKPPNKSGSNNDSSILIANKKTIQLQDKKIIELTSKIDKITKENQNFKDKIQNLEKENYKKVEKLLVEIKNNKTNIREKEEKMNELNSYIKKLETNLICQHKNFNENKKMEVKSDKKILTTYLSPRISKRDRSFRSSSEPNKLVSLIKGDKVTKELKYENDINKNKRRKYSWRDIYEKLLKSFKINVTIDDIDGKISAKKMFKESLVTLSNTTSNWEDKIKAMITIGKYVEYTRKLNNNQIENLKRVLSTQIVDLRSNIVKTVCKLLSYISKVCSNDFEISQSYFLNFLFSRVYCTVKAQRDPCIDCIMAIINNTESTRLIKDLLHFCKDSHIKIRKLVMTILSNFLEILYRKGLIDKYIDSVERIIVKCLKDANESVRKETVISFYKLKELWPEKANKLLRKVDKNERKLIEKGI